MTAPSSQSNERRPHTQVVFADSLGHQFAVSVFGALSHDEVVAEGRTHLRDFIDMGAWEPVGEPTYLTTREGS